MRKPPEENIGELIEAVRASHKYQAISADLIRTIGLRELAARRSLKEAIKATKNKLHQVAGAYLDTRPPYAEWLERLAAAAGDRPAGPLDRHLAATPGQQDAQIFSPELRRVCLELMRSHASTRERLPLLETFYTTTLAPLLPLRSVLDVGCGLNPLALPWMPFEINTRYYACDLYADMIEFLNGFFGLAGMRGQAQVCDLVGAPPRQQADIALVLKVLPPLEQQAKNAGRDLLRALDTPYMLVSFPAQSLGGRNKRMTEHYEQWFRALADAEGWSIERFAFASELAFVVRK